MELLRVLGEDVRVAFLEECEAAYLRFAPRVVDTIFRGVGMGVRDSVAKQTSTYIYFFRRIRV